MKPGGAVALRRLARLACIAVALAGLGSLYTARAATVSIVSSPVLTNVTDTSFTVSWITNVPAHGYVRFGTSAGQLASRAEDERGADYVGYTHHVRVMGLLAGTRYYYGVTSDDATSDSASYYLTTGAAVGSPPAPSPNLFSGQVWKSDGQTPAGGAIVYVYLQHKPGTAEQKNSSRLSALTNSAGTFEVDISLARELGAGQTFPSFFTYALDDVDRIYYQVDGGIGYGGVINRVPWDSVYTSSSSAGSSPGPVDVQLRYADQATPTPTSEATQTPTPTTARTATAGPRVTGTPARSPSQTPSAAPAVAPTRAPAPTPSPPASPTAPPPTPPPPTATPSPVPTATATAGFYRPPAGPVRTPASPAAGFASRAAPAGQPSPRASASPAPATPAPTEEVEVAASAGPELSPSWPGWLLALVGLAVVLTAAGLGLVTVGIVAGLRRRSA